MRKHKNFGGKIIEKKTVKRNRAITYSFRVSERERRIIDEKVKTSGLSRTDFLIRALTDKPVVVFECSGEILQELKRQGNKMSVFSGLVYCADCGKKMYLCRCSKSKQKDYFNCSTYRKKTKHLCTSHQITVEAVEHLVLTDLQRVLAAARANEKQFAEMLFSVQSKETKKALAAKAKECEEAEKRIAALDRIIQTLYEDKISGAITQERFARMSKAYEQEQQTLTERVSKLRAEISAAKKETDNAAKFMRMVKRYTEIEKLTPEIVREFIEKVIVHQAENIDGIRRQKVEIIYNCVGAIPSETL